MDRKGVMCKLCEGVINMNQIKRALEKGLSREQERLINVLVGVTMASGLESKDKKECVNFLRELEMFLDGFYFDEDAEAWQEAETWQEIFDKRNRNGVKR